PLQVTVPRPPSNKNKMPTPAEDMVEQAHYVKHFTTQPISDYGEASVPLETGLTRVMSPKKYTFTSPAMTGAGEKFRNFRVEFLNMPVSPEYGLPMDYGTPEAYAVIEGEVVLECNYECKAVDFKVGCCVTGRVTLG
ncbi:hypothetical protein BGZ93_003783, partial [Podila epicladia]